jgi:hypothetical protein
MVCVGQESIKIELFEKNEKKLKEQGKPTAKKLLNLIA